MVHLSLSQSLSHRASLSQSPSSHLKLSSLKILSSSLSQHHSLKLTLSPSLAQLILNVSAFETRRHRHTNRPKPLISLRPMPPFASNPYLVLFTHTLSLYVISDTFRSLSLSLSLSPFLASIGSHITRLTSDRSIPFHFALIITVYDH